MHSCVVSKYIRMPSNCIRMLLNFQGRQVCLQNAMVYFQSTFAYDWNKLLCIRTLRMLSYAFKTYSYTLKNISMVSIYFSSYTFLHSYAIMCQINVSPLVNWTTPFLLAHPYLLVYLLFQIFFYSFTEIDDLNTIIPISKFQ